MIRPHAGTFVYDRAERRGMVAAIRNARAAGADGIVTGALTHAAMIDEAAMREWLDAAAGVPVTFHRAFDRVVDQPDALEALIALGVHRVLTAGGAATAWAGRGALARLVRQAHGRIGIVAAGSVRARHVRHLAAASGVREIHAHVDGMALQALGAATAA